MRFDAGVIVRAARVRHHSPQLSAAEMERTTDLDQPRIIWAKAGTIAVRIDLNQHRNTLFRFPTSRDHRLRLVQAVQHDR